MPDQTQQVMKQLIHVSDVWVRMKDKVQDLDHDDPQTAAICDAVTDLWKAAEQVAITYKLVTGETLC